METLRTVELADGIHVRVLARPSGIRLDVCGVLLLDQHAARQLADIANYAARITTVRHG